jgi:phosphatidylethanolamine/phosphatidyl-N-methylethanolamine N-methyltransferase
MTILPHYTMAKSLVTEESKLLFKQWLKSPMQIGTFAPISLKLAHLTANQLEVNNSPTVVEIGAGTGRLTQALLAKGVNIDKLAMIDLDPRMCDFLKYSLQSLYQTKTKFKIVQGNAEKLPDLIPKAWVGKVDYVVSAIPLMCFEEAIRERIIQAALDVLNPVTGSIYHVTYSPVSPIKFMEGDILQKRVVSLWGNMPPGFVWKFTPKRYSHNLS